MTREWNSLNLKAWMLGAMVVGLIVDLSASYGQSSFVNWESPHVSPIALTPSRNTLLAVNVADNRLEVFDVSGGTPVHLLPIPVGLDPVSVRTRTETEAWVINRVSDSISIVNLTTGNVIRTIGTGDEPADVVFAGSPQRAFVAVAGLNQIRVWNPANITAAPTIINIQGQDPRSLAVSADGTRVYVSIFQSQNATGVVRQQDVSNPAGPYAGANPPPNSGNLFNPPITVPGPPPPPVAQIVRRDANNHWMDDNNHDWSSMVTWNVLDHDVAIIDAQTLAVSYANSMMTNVMGIGVKPDGKVTIVGTEALNQIRFAENVKSIFIRSMMGTFDPATPTVKQVVDLNPHLNYTVKSVSPDQRKLSIGDPRAVVWDSAGNGYVAGMGSNDVIVIDGNGQRLTSIDVEDGPTGLALNEAKGRLYVMDKFAGKISTISLATRMQLSSTPFFDPTPNAIKEGRPLLYNTHDTSGLGQASCASCHIDAGADFLAWDLGDPQGTLKTVDGVCRQGPGQCRSWHPMKGPMVTQSLQGIIGKEPLHWRGDRANLGQFDAAFVDLQGLDFAPSSGQMQKMSDFLSTIVYPPNPARNTDGALAASLASSGGGTGNPTTGLTLFNTLPILGPPPGGTCVSCHTLPAGTGGTIDDPRLPLAPQALKVVQLRGLNKKVGWDRNSQTNTRGFGFNHQSEFDTLFALLGAGFNFQPNAQGQQQKRDIEAFLLSLTNDTHAGIGQQVTFDGSNNTNSNDVGRLMTFVNLANINQAGLIAKGLQGGVRRGWTYVAGGAMQSDNVTSSVGVAALRLSASSGSEITFTLVPAGSQMRVGIDRDSDGYFDQDEIDAGSNPADALSVPPCLAIDFNCDGHVDASDLATFQSCNSGPKVQHADNGLCNRADLDNDGDVDQDDFAKFQRCNSGTVKMVSPTCLD